MAKKIVPDEIDWSVADISKWSIRQDYDYLFKCYRIDVEGSFAPSFHFYPTIGVLEDLYGDFISLLTKNEKRQLRRVLKKTIKQRAIEKFVKERIAIEKKYGISK